MSTPLPSRAPHIEIDWSMDFSEMENGLEAEKMIEWIRTYPQRQCVHVSLRSCEKRLQKALLSLGCRVTSHTKTPLHV